jgi:hypothetical protein
LGTPAFSASLILAGFLSKNAKEVEDSYYDLG